MPNSATLVQALGAAFCAILCALSSLGGGGMMIGARTAAWAKSGPTARDYVQVGLVAMWDGKENAGWGVHDPNAKAWKNLVGNQSYDWTLTSHASFGWDHIYLDGQGVAGTSSLFDSNDAITIESVLLAENTNSGTRQVFFRLDSGWVSGSTIYVKRCLALADWNPSALILSHAKCRNMEVFGNALAVSCGYSGNQAASLFVNNSSLSFNNGNGTASQQNEKSILGCLSETSTTYGKGKLFCVRVYNRTLSAEERDANYAIDKARFNLPDAA